MKIKTKTIAIIIAVVFAVVLFGFSMARTETSSPIEELNKQEAKLEDEKYQLVTERRKLLEELSINSGQIVDLNKKLGELYTRQKEILDVKKEVVHSVEEDKEVANEEIPYQDAELMEKICKYGQKDGKTTKLCGNWDLYNNLRNISKERGVDFRLMLGITLAESHIGVNWKPHEHCKNSNNWAGIKWRVYDDGTTSEKYDKQYINMSEEQRGNLKGCYLYNFDSVEEFWRSFANSLQKGYVSKGCDYASCISKWWVKGDGVTDKNRNRTVEKML